jgi:hypothetical protein
MTHPKLAVVKSGYGGRGYRIPGRMIDSPKTGKPIQRVYPSVTTVLKQVSKPGLHQWIADQTAAFAVMNVGYLMQVESAVAWRSLRFRWSKDADLEGTELRRYYDGVKDDAADLGTNIHEWIQADLDAVIPYPDLLAVETEQMIEAFREWLQYHDVIVHNSEFTCVNDDWGVAGTADGDWSIRCVHEKPCLGQPEGEWVRTLIDLKSSRNTWRENGYQLAALASCNVVMREVLPGTDGAQRFEKTEKGVKHVSWWVEDAPPVWERYALLHIRPDDLDTQGNTVPRFCVLKDRTDDMDLYTQGFRGALALAESEKALKDRALDRNRTEEDI